VSIQEVERVMQRALREEAFRDLLRENPGAALASYELTPDERAALLRAGAGEGGTLPPGTVTVRDPAELARELTSGESTP
jgi:hypothetical protein